MKENKIKSCFALFLTFLKASTFTFAGGLAILPAIENDVVKKYKFLEKDEFMEYATLSQTMPGVIALNCATLIGRKTAGFWGMLAAGLGAIFPAYILMVVATILAKSIPQEGRILSVMRGIRAASAALILSAAFSLGRHNLKSNFSVIIMIAALFLAVVCNISAPIVILLAGIAGFVYQYLLRRKDRGSKNV